MSDKATWYRRRSKLHGYPVWVTFAWAAFMWLPHVLEWWLK